MCCFHLTHCKPISSSPHSPHMPTSRFVKVTLSYFGKEEPYLLQW
uniref:Uncharacterized protein n=1 Tax=Zea mays TaxID=4577 RepID=B8A194_MAIZE|nr:unknown [Zea mays]